MSDGKVANQQSLQVATLKENLNEYKFIVANIDQVLNTADPVKTSVAHAGLYTGLYAVMLICKPSVLTFVSVSLAIYLIVETFIGKFNEKVFGSKPFTEDQEGRFHRVCETLTGLQANACQGLSCIKNLKAQSPYRFLSFALPILATTAFIGQKVTLTTLIWAFLMSQCLLMIPQVKLQIDQVQGKITGLMAKNKKA